MTALALPTWLAVGGIVLRGAGFAFRKEITRVSLQRVAGAAFAFSSLVSPFFMGMVVGAIATGAFPADASHASLAAWTSPTALLAGFVFVAAVIHGTPPTAATGGYPGAPSVAHSGPPSPNRHGSATRAVTLALVAIAAISRRRSSR
jgi:bd-type cytochrome oxidase subunit II